MAKERKRQDIWANYNSMLKFTSSMSELRPPCLWQSRYQPAFYWLRRD